MNNQGMIIEKNATQNMANNNAYSLRSRFDCC